MTTRANRVCKVLVISLVLAAISRGEAVKAATLPVVTAQGTIEQGLRTPTRLAVGADGSLYVADPANQGVLKFSTAGKLKKKFSVKGIPQGVAITADGRLLVSLKESVAIYDAAGAEIGKLGSGVGQFKLAADIALDDFGLIYVTDSKGACVQIFKSDGTYVSRFGVNGSSEGQLKYPTSIAYEKVSKQIAVVDSLNGRVLFFNLSGAFVRSIGDLGTGPLKFMHPQGLAFEYGAADSIRMYVSDAMLRKVQVIDPTGTGMFLTYINDAREGHSLPSELVFDQTAHRLYIVDGLGSVSFDQITDGSVVVNSGPQATPGNAAVIVSTANPAGSAATMPPTTTVSPFVLSTVADGSTVTFELLDITGVVSGVSAITVNGQPVAVANGLFNAALPLVDGANEITVMATDLAGTTWKEVRKVTRNAGAPLLTVAAADVQSTSKALLNLKGTTDRGAFVAVAGVPADLNKLEWSSAITLTPGLNTVEVQAIDLTGQVSNMKRTVFYKPAAPDLAVTSPIEDVITSKKSLTIRGSVSSPDEVKVTAEINGMPKKVSVDSGQFSITVEFQQEGAYTLTLFAGANGGDVSTVSRTIIYRKAQ